MSTYTELRHEKGEKVGELAYECGLFWAFSDEQFKKNKTPLKDGEKYVSIGAGGFLPKSKVKTFTEGMDRIEQEHKKAVKKHREQAILYELNNHEAFYTGSIDENCMETIKSLGFTRKQAEKVYRDHRQTYNQTAGMAIN